MIRKFLSLLVALTMLSCVVAFGYEQPNYTLGENILLNGGFENGISNWDT